MKHSRQFLEGVQWAFKQAEDIYNLYHPSARVTPYLNYLHKLAWDTNPDKEKLEAESKTRVASYTAHVKKNMLTVQ